MILACSDMATPIYPLYALALPLLYALLRPPGAWAWRECTGVGSPWAWVLGALGGGHGGRGPWPTCGMRHASWPCGAWGGH